MDKESANWCRTAQAIMQKGGEVLRQFLLIEILTQSFNNNVKYWKEHVHNPLNIKVVSMLLQKFTCILKNSQNSGDLILNNLLKSWTAVTVNQMAIMEQIEWLNQWRNDIENERSNSISTDVDKILVFWLKIIETEIKNMDPICKVISRWNSTFHDDLQKAQIALFLEIEKNDGFLSRCSHQVRSLSTPSSSEFKQLVQTFKTELNSWKEKCRNIYKGFRDKCIDIKTQCQNEPNIDTNGYGIKLFLSSFETEIEKCKLESQVNEFCGRWVDELHEVFDTYDRQIQEGDSTETLLILAEGLCKKLEEFSSFKERKMKDFFSSFKPPTLPGQLTNQCSKLNQIYRSSELNECDPTMLMIAIKHGSLVHSPLNDWNDNENNWDTSITADVGRLRVHRNTVVAHIAQLRISDEKFEELWKGVRKLLRKIASRCGDQFSLNIIAKIDQMKDCPFEPDREYEMQREFLTWCKRDILAQLSARSTAAPQCLDMLQSIQTALEKLAKRMQALTCRICHIDFSTESELAEHMRLHQDFRCLGCKKTFSTDNELTNHMKCHQDRACRMCKMVCSTEWEFRRHMWCNQDCRCIGCDGAFLTESVFEEHVTYHKALNCSICNKGHSTELEFFRHMLDHQARTCLSCKMAFPEENEFGQHIMSHQARTCRICKKDFPTANELELHMRSHQGRICDRCNVDFSTPIELEEHMKYHQARTCRSCSKECSTVIELEEHMRYHQDGPNDVTSPETRGSSVSQVASIGAVAATNQCPAGAVI